MLGKSRQQSDERAGLTEPRHWLPPAAWLLSISVHFLVVMLAAIAYSYVPQPRGAMEETTRPTGIVLKKIEPEGEYYEGEDDLADQAAESAQMTLAEMLPQAANAPSDPTTALPSTDIGVGPSANSGEAGGGNLSLAGKSPGSRNISGGKARTGVFGTSGEGHSFVYVFDCSASMGSPNGRPLAAAKKELLESIKSLGEMHQFQIIFYNERPQVLNLTGTPGKLTFGNEANKDGARRFVSRIEAELSTQHEPALLLAVNMRPDVIFFLTDADDPILDDRQLARIRRINGGVSAIHTIEFGIGGSTPNNFLQKLAHQNSGSYVFFDVRRLSPR